MYDFDSRVSRVSTGSFKHDHAPEPVKNAGHIPLTIADMELKMPSALSEALIEAAKHGVCGYTYADDAYFEAVRGFLGRRHGFFPERESLINTSGVVTALHMLIRALTNENDGVIIQPPVYPPFRMAVRENGRKLLNNPLLLGEDGRYRMDFEGLEALCAREEAKLLILCSPHNPVGRVWTLEELTRLGEICLKHGVFVVADEIHFDLAMFHNKHTVFSTIKGFENNCAVCTSISKTFNTAGLCCSNIFIADKARREAFEKVADREAPFGIPYFARAATIAAYTRCDAWLDALLSYVEGNFNTLDSFLRERLPMLRLIKPEGTYLAWVDMHALGLDKDALEALMLNKALLALDEGYIFGEEGAGFERINLALPRKELLYALERLEKAVFELKSL